MFAKLLKYEWRSNAATFGILSVCALGVSLLGGLALYFTIHYGEQMQSLTSTVLFGTFPLCMLALIGYAAAVWILLLVRFYKSRFTDEGYLTFTLPVNAHQVFLSSAVNMALWSIISLVVLLVCIALMALISQFWKAMDGLDLILTDIAGLFVDLEDSVPSIPLYIADGLFSAVSTIVIPMTCLTLGSVVAKKHKILAAFGFYYGISMVVNFVTGLLSLLVGLHSVIGATDDLAAFENITLLSQIILNVVLILGGYFTSTYLMKRELNLN